MADSFEIEILPDGTIKVTTDGVSGANHINAEAYMKYLAEMTAGPVDRKRRGSTHHEHQHHEHEKERH